MKDRYYPKRVNPKTMITHFSEMFKPLGLKKPQFRNLLLSILGVCVAKTFRINEIASRLPIVVATEKSRQKRFLRFLETALPLGRIQHAYFTFAVRHLCRHLKARLFFVDERDLIGGWKAIVAAIAFRHRAIPVLWLIYKDEDIQSGKYKSHNEIVQRLPKRKWLRSWSLTGGSHAESMSSSFSKTERFHLSCASVATPVFGIKGARRNLMPLKISFMEVCFITQPCGSPLNSTSAEIPRKTRCI